MAESNDGSAGKQEDAFNSKNAEKEQHLLSDVNINGELHNTKDSDSTVLNQEEEIILQPGAVWTQVFK